ncbi:uncharacterized protein ISCGN_002089 [Ixodes scapularis]
MERLKGKRTALRTQVTKLLSEIDSYIKSNEKNEKNLSISSARLGALQAQLNEVDAAIEPLVPEGEAEQNFVRTIEYNDRVVTCIATLQEELKEVRGSAPRNLDSSPMSNNGNATTTACRVKLPKLELHKFDGKSISWQEFWEQFEQAWLGEINEYAQDDVVIMLIGNKADIQQDRQVRYEDGERLAREYGVAFMETSAKTGANVELAFMAVARELKQRMSRTTHGPGRFNMSEYIRQESQVKSNGCCSS